VAKATIGRADPEQLLRQAQAEEQYERRGRLKIFLGYSSGVGKSYRMLDEGRRRRERGEDVIVGAIQPAPSPEVESLLQKLEVIPLKAVQGVPVMDLEAILFRHPQVCIVDGLAYDNPSGSRHAKRWQDVEELLAAGISVIGSVNLQHIEEQLEQVQRITGKKVSGTIPLSFIYTTDEIEVVDAPPDMCLGRGADPEWSEDTSATRERQLSQLREITLLLVADVVDRQLAAYLRHQGIEQHWGAQERVLVWVTPYTDAAAIIASGRRNAERFQGELFVVYFSQPDLAPNDKGILERNLADAQDARARIELLDAEDQVEAVIRFARANAITQIFVKRNAHENLWDRFFGNRIDRLIRAAEGIDVRVFPNKNV